MKTIQNNFKIFFLLCTFFFFHNANAQAPKKMSYQAVVRNTSNVLVTSAPVGIRVSILSGSASGPSVYTETHSLTTNTNGLVSFEIGTGSIVSGIFSFIVWDSGLFFIKTEIDPTGGTSYTITGTTQLLSVPYALYAEKAKSNCNSDVECPSGMVCVGGFCVPHIPTGANIGDMQYWNGTSWVTLPVGTPGQALKLNASNVPTWSTVSTSVGGFTHHLGEEYLGGIIFYLYKGSDGLEHGLIVALTESTPLAWQTTGTLVNANRSWDGAFNTPLMTGSPASTYITSLGAGWYLPSIDELGKLYYNRFETNKALFTGFHTLLSGTYWSSTEFNSTTASNFFFSTGSAYLSIGNKTVAYTARGVRAF